MEGRDEFVEVGSGPTYRIKTADSGKRLRFEFTPVRDDGVAGQVCHHLYVCPFDFCGVSA